VGKEGNMAQSKEFKIVVNGTLHTVSTEVLTFDAVVDIAFPGHPTDPNVVFSVTFDKADSKPRQGTLSPGGTVTIKNNTVFDVTQTNRS
jgi:Multiubiquitin